MPEWRPSPYETALRVVEGEHVGGRADVLGGGELFRGHVGRRAQDAGGRAGDVGGGELGGAGR
ncbi:hypothetical protein [Streptomyces sp. NPDC093598]|uniref:hypothetical protein n=1 Tax=Streptomyces sp. NPDC093598 TaxID=3366046 RepID=UPI0037F242F3